MSQTTTESPPPLSQNTKPSPNLSATKTLLKLYKWIADPFDFMDCEALLTKMIDKAEQNAKNITLTTTSQTKKKDWEIMHAATIVISNAFTAKWEHQAFETMAARMEERVDGYFEARDEEQLCLRVTEAIWRRFEAKLTEMVGVATTLTLNNETTFTQIVADRVQANLQKPIAKIEKEAEAAFMAAQEVAQQCDSLLSKANETMKAVKEKIEGLSEGLTTSNGSRPNNDWSKDIDGIEEVVNGSKGKSFTNAATSEMDRGVGRVASALQAPHAQAIQDAKTAFRKVVIMETGQSDGWISKMSEMKIVVCMNEALKAVEEEEIFTTDPKPSGSFVLARKILGGALIFMSNEETPVWMRRGGQLASCWMNKWKREAYVVVDTQDVVVEMVPVTENLELDLNLRKIEETNLLTKGAIFKARWIKPVERCKKAIRNGLVFQGRALEVRKSLPEPRICLKCHKSLGTLQKIANKRVMHVGSAQKRTTRQSAITEGHGASDCMCPTFIWRRKVMWLKCINLQYKYFVNNNPKSWELFKETRRETFNDSWREKLVERDEG
ncbi:hypothetical protein BT96DRAFT_948330 [Gymnopus androsaceus JB14]|uniref:Uncharacterized protein n=1 Tax=Gymnopus androsaceus JB14 TaxID=1447944 RepID=A0A6A4GPE5_9AGAR|nr:hypothetical protein BT96DRAFT_948330 [Gymnopus androsaceus JB14]